MRGVQGHLARASRQAKTELSGNCLPEHLIRPSRKAKVEFSERRAGALSEGEPTGEDGA